jgi:hypothetical protein
MSINDIKAQVEIWNLAKPVRINREALAIFKDGKHSPADYISAGLKGTSVWGAIYAALYTLTSGVVISSKSYSAIGENYHLITNHKDKATMEKHLDEVLAGVKAEEESQDAKDDADGKAIATDMSNMMKVAKKAAKHRAVPTDDNIKAAEALFAFATANLNRFTLAVDVKAKKAGKATISK